MQHGKGRRAKWTEKRRGKGKRERPLIARQLTPRAKSQLRTGEAEEVDEGGGAMDGGGDALSSFLFFFLVASSSIPPRWEN